MEARLGERLESVGRTWTPLAGPGTWKRLVVEGAWKAVLADFGRPWTTWGELLRGSCIFRSVSNGAQAARLGGHGSPAVAQIVQGAVAMHARRRRAGAEQARLA